MSEQQLGGGRISAPVRIGETVGERHRWSAWVYADAAVGAWMRRLHDVTAAFWVTPQRR